MILQRRTSVIIHTGSLLFVKSKQILVAAMIAPDTRKPVVQNPAVQVSINHLFNVRAKKTVLPLEPLIIDLLEGFKMILHTLIVGRVLRVALAVYGFRTNPSSNLRI